MRTFKKKAGNPAAKQKNRFPEGASDFQDFGDHGNYSNTNFDSENEECRPPQGGPRPNPNMRCTSSFQSIQGRSDLGFSEPCQATFPHRSQGGTRLGFYEPSQIGTTSPLVGNPPGLHEPSQAGHLDRGRPNSAFNDGSNYRHADEAYRSCARPDTVAGPGSNGGDFRSQRINASREPGSISEGDIGDANRRHPLVDVGGWGPEEMFEDSMDLTCFVRGLQEVDGSGLG